MNTRATRMDDVGFYFDDFADIDRSDKPNTSDIDCYTISFCPIPGAGICRLINPFHDYTSVYFTAEIDVSGLADELKGDLMIGFHMASFIGKSIKSCTPAEQVNCILIL
jgi:hypothetical protein